MKFQGTDKTRSGSAVIRSNIDPCVEIFFGQLDLRSQFTMSGHTDHSHRKSLHKPAVNFLVLDKDMLCI
jgi:hypothetical protein